MKLQIFPKKSPSFLQSKRSLPFSDTIPDLYFDLSPDLLCIVSREGYFLELNKAWEINLGYTRAKLMSKPFFDFIHPEDVLNTSSEFEKLLMGKEIFNFTNRYKCKDGSFRFLEWKGRLNETHNLIYASARDVSERKLLEEQLRQEQLVHYALTSAAKDSIIMLDNDGKITFWNDSASNLIGYSKEEVMGMKLHEFVVPVKLKAQFEQAYNSFKGNGTGNVIGKSRELSLLHKNGNEIPAELSLSALKINGKWCSIGILRDITERKRALEERREVEERYRHMFEDVNIGIYRTSPHGSVMMANPTACKMLGYSSFEELSDRNLEKEKFEPKYARSSFRNQLETEGEIKGLESEWIRQDGTTLYVRENAKVKRDPDGNVLYYDGTIEDLTEQKISERLIRESEEKYRLLSEYLKSIISTKDKLFSIIAHDLRGPITSFNQVLDLFTNSYNLGEREKESLFEEIKKSSKNISDLLENLLSWSRLQRNEIKLDPHNFVLNQSVHENIELLNTTALKKNIRIIVKTEEKYMVNADKITVDLIIRNLLTNGIKFTKPEGSISVTMRDNGNQIETIVSDTGVGMDKEFIENLFTNHTFISSYGTNREKGTGLGIVLVKEFVERSGGRLHVESIPGKGSTFTFSLPKGS